ncbi:MAG: DoxX family protein [Candidatus Marinimicrobia bacterium]|nr:DoxX family protein [Candidatus Neomarinimicrobiota bacterium]MCF7829021.1 DoxX family protein [Candidatus Neomarinimicrobiota bacterium]MCF7881842.1 DoxX family protein [Candidatus Neomarinimicrobiota bacterium]
MNIFLWVLQILLALHTAIGAMWKFSNPAEQAIPSLKAIPHPVWISMSIVEVGLVLCLVLPAIVKSLGILAPIAAAGIAAEMLLFCAVHLVSDETNNSPIIYWSVVAVISAFLAYGRFAIQPL